MTTETQMPRFDFSGMTLSDEKYEEEAKKQGGKYLGAGLHEVTIAEAVFDKTNQFDPRWSDVKVTYKGQGDKTCNEWVSVPSSTIYFKGKGGTESLGSFKRLVKFAAALGVDLKPSNVAQAIPTLFADPKKLVGSPLKVRLGYNKAHAESVGQGDARKYKVVLADGNTLKAANGADVLFADMDAAKAHCTAKSIAFSGIPNVQEYDLSATPAKIGSDTGW